MALEKVLHHNGWVRRGRQAHPLSRGRVNHPPMVKQEQAIAVIHDVQIQGRAQEVEPAADPPVAACC